MAGLHSAVRPRLPLAGRGSLTRRQHPSLTPRGYSHVHTPSYVWGLNSPEFRGVKSPNNQGYWPRHQYRLMHKNIGPKVPSSLEPQHTSLVMADRSL
jgi:hypothetical protein